MQEQPQSFRRHIRLALIVPILLAGVVGGVFVAQTYYLRAAFHSVERSYLAQTRSRTVLKLILDMETGLRGYLLTGEDHFLEPYSAAQTQVQPALSGLLSLVREDPDEYRAVIRTQTYYEEWLAYSRQTIAARKKSSPSADYRQNLQGKQFMDFIRRDCEEIMRLEQDRVNGKIESVARMTSGVLITTLGVSLLLGLVLATFSRKELSTVAHSYDTALHTAEARTQEFEESQRWLGAVLGSIGDSVIVTENTGKIVFTNPVAKQLLGDGHELYAGQLARDAIRLVDESTQEPLADVYQDVLRTGETVFPTAKLVLQRRDGKNIPVSQVVSPLRGEDRRVTGAVIVLRDLTQQRSSERALQSSEKLAVMGRLAASVAHEIHNPLDALGNLLYLLDHQLMEESSRSYLRLAQEELERITSISEQMLTFSREARQPVKIYLSDIVENVLALFMARIRRVGIVLVTQYPAKSGAVVALPGEMRQVFSNLVGNAIDAMPAGGRLVIRIEETHSWSQAAQQGVRVLVCDTGNGIPPDVRVRLMDAFVTSKGEKGTGLGLWVCRGIVEKYHGTIRYHSSSEPGHSGTCFSVFLPSWTVTGGTAADVASKERAG
jgi:PAS domain S-box-containing protein